MKTKTNIVKSDGKVISKSRWYRPFRAIKNSRICIVKGCLNYSNEGEFIGDLCVPCYEMLTTGRIHHANRTFIGDMNRDNIKKENEIKILKSYLFR